MIKPEDVAKILDATQIVDVIGAFVPLRKRGANYIGLCPFHNEKTPSFNVSPSRGIFKCFGCGEGGNAVSFLMKHENYTYVEALKWLAQRYNISIEERELTQQEKQEQTERDRIYHVNEFAQRYFHDILLNDDEGRSVGLSYFRERELDKETIVRWGLGYCKDSWSDFTDAALSNGYSEEDLVKSGLSIRNENNGRLYDRFRGRVCFPIYNVGGRPLGFSARILSADKTKAKYVNSPESVIYSKGKVLFGLHLAKNEMAKQDMCYLVEGNMDVVMMSQNGVKNVVATSGTALTEDQIRLIKRYTENVTILYDGDKAGIKATFKAIDLFLKNGLKVRTLLFPDGEDPDSFARKHTQEEFREFLQNNTEDFILYKTNLLLEQTQKDPIKKAELVRDIVQTIALIPNTLERSTYLQECGRLLDVKEEVLYSELSKSLRNNVLKEHQKQQIEEGIEQAKQIMQSSSSAHKNEYSTGVNPDYEQEKAIIGILFNYSDVLTTQKIFSENGELEERDIPAASFIVCDIANDGIEFEDKLFGQIFDVYRKAIYENGQVPEVSYFVSNENEEIRKLAADLLVKSYEISPYWEEKRKISIPRPESKKQIDKHITETLLRFKIHKITGYISKIDEQLAAETDEEKQTKLVEKLMELKHTHDRIAGELNMIVTV